MSASDSTAPIVYRTIAEAPGYEFGSDSSVWTCWKRGRYPMMTSEWRPMTPTLKSHGFSELKIRIDGEMTRVYLHDMICRAFVGPRPDGHDCIFLDGNRDNLSPDNLAWRCLIAEAIESGVEFRSIPESEGYLFGSDGSIWSSWGSGSDAPGDVWRPLILTPDPSGHLNVRVKINGQQTSVGAHHMTCWAYNGPSPEGMECCHKDGSPANNVPGNLYWGTYKQNVADQIAHGVFAMGERHGMASFAEDEVREIREMYAAGLSCGQIARMKNRSRNTIKSIVGRQTWKHVI